MNLKPRILFHIEGAGHYGPRAKKVLWKKSDGHRIQGGGHHVTLMNLKPKIFVFFFTEGAGHYGPRAKKKSSKKSDGHRENKLCQCDLENMHPASPNMINGPSPIFIRVYCKTANISVQETLANLAA